MIVATLATAILMIVAGSVGAQGPAMTGASRDRAAPRPEAVTAASDRVVPVGPWSGAASGMPVPARTVTSVAAPRPALAAVRPAQPVPAPVRVAVDAAPVLPPVGAPVRSGSAPRVTGNGPPACDYLDVPTPHDDLDDWDRTLLDTVYALPSGYAPGDLVDTSVAGLNGGHAVRGLVVDDLRAMADAARAAGAPLGVVSAYRSYSRQGATFARWVSAGGHAQALRTSARPGHSEHQLGTTLDLTSEGGADPWHLRDWAATPAGGWVARNAWRYGFVVSYPAGASARTCYSYEPWHVRYVGRSRAAAIESSGLTPREVLWALQ